MRTRFTCLIICLVVICPGLTSAFSRTVNSQEAKRVANHQLLKLSKVHSFNLKESQEISKDGLTLAYVFDLEPSGYIVVAASTGFPPVIAYSFESNFGEMNPGNPLFELLKADLNKRMAFSNISGSYILSKNETLWQELLNDDYIVEADPLFEQWPATGDGWLKTNWTQDPPYNNFCPMDPVTGQRSYAGCPSTAMAQIMNFHQTTNQTHFDDTDDYYHNYAGRQYWIDDDCAAIDFPCFAELNTYLDTLNAHYLSNTSLTNDDKAALTFACGVAAKQVYTSQGSGTFGVIQAYDAYIRFGCSTVELLDSTDADLYDRLKQNVKDTLPAHLAIVDESWSTGHNVVVDGYNTDDYYHLNFGWGGAYNGWYLLPQEIPYELTVIEGLVVDIMKNIPTGISSGDTCETSISLFPNPVTDIASLTYNLNEKSPVIFTISNTSGKIILREQFNSQLPGRYSIPLSFEDHPSGLYFITLQTAYGFSAAKIVKAE